MKLSVDLNSASKVNQGTYAIALRESEIEREILDTEKNINKLKYLNLHYKEMLKYNVHLE